MAKKWTLYASADTARMYMLEEYGAAFVEQRMTSCGRDHRGWVAMHDLTTRQDSRKGYWTKGDLERFAAYIQMMVAYHEGKNGLGLTGGSLSPVYEGC